MPAWELAVTLDPAADQAIFVQIARAIAADVQRGRLRPGDELPGSRTLATSLGVHRNTVLAAYAELAVEGWTTTEPARGTFVSASIPEQRPRRWGRSSRREGVPAEAGYDLGPACASSAPRVHPRGTIVLEGGVPDVRLLPALALARAYRRSLRTRPAALLDYGDPRGDARLREALATMVSARRGLAATADAIVVTRGSQMALDLLARVLIAPGDVVAVDALGYRPAWEAFRLAGARLVPIPVDRGGTRVDALEALVKRERVRAVYVTPHHHYPTTVVLGPARRLALLALARAHRIAVVEDDYDHEFHYGGRPVLPLASADDAGVVAYVGTLSKLLAPGLRLGFLVAPEPLVARVAALRSNVDRQGDHALERAVTDLLEDGDVQRHARKARRAYEARRDALAEALRRELGSAVTFDVPAGGMAMWVRVAPDIDADAWAARALDLGVAFAPGRRFAFDGRSRPYVRLGFAGATEVEIREGIRRAARALLRSRVTARAASGGARGSRR